MAAPSEIPSHPQVEAVDSDGDSFPSGSSFHLISVGAKSTQSLAFDPQTGGVTTAAPNNDNQWLVEHHDTRGRWQIAIKLESNGKYLAASSPESRTPFWLTESPQFWYVYTGAQPDSFWLSTLQSTDGFLYRHEKAGVKLMTGEEGSSQAWRKWNDELSWRFEGSREYMKTKYTQKRAEAQQVKEELDKRAKELDDRELSAKKYRDESDKHVKKAKEESEHLALTGKEETEAAKKKAEDELAARETKLKAAEQVAKKKQDELAAREAKVTTAEERIKQSKKGVPADLLKSEQEKERLVDELSEQLEKNRSLTADKQNLQDELQTVRAQLDKAPATSSAGLTTTKNAPGTILGRPKAAAIPAPRSSRPKQTRPNAVRPPSKRPKATLPPATKPSEVHPPNTSPVTDSLPGKKPRSELPRTMRQAANVPRQTRPPTEVPTKTRPDEDQAKEEAKSEDVGGSEQIKPEEGREIAAAA